MRELQQSIYGFIFSMKFKWIQFGIDCEYTYIYSKCVYEWFACPRTLKYRKTRIISLLLRTHRTILLGKAMYVPAMGFGIRNVHAGLWWADAMRKQIQYFHFHSAIGMYFKHPNGFFSFIRLGRKCWDFLVIQYFCLLNNR